MKPKQAVTLGIIGMTLTIFPYILNFFIPFDRTFFISNYMRIIGCIFMIIFFNVFIMKRKEDTSLRAAEVCGLIGYLLLIVLNVLDMISNSVFIIAKNDPVKYMDLMIIASKSSSVNLLTGLIPTVLIIVSFIIFYRNLNKTVVMPPSARARSILAGEGRHLQRRFPPAR